MLYILINKNINMNIKKIINSIDLDKKDHVLLGIAIGYPLMIIGYLLDLTLGYDFLLIFGAIAGIIAVGAKEVIHDWLMGKGCPEWWDFIASAIPIVFPLLCYLA
tara:strand:- start:4033 stop:4347 length:315 start_codon:yes stop_codon:yes gene_type:complete